MEGWVNDLPNDVQEKLANALREVLKPDQQEDIVEIAVDAMLDSRIVDIVHVPELKEVIDTMYDPMFKSILRFMQNNDHNGDWLTCTPKEHGSVILQTIRDWIVDSGMKVTPRVKDYIHYLERLPT